MANRLSQYKVFPLPVVQKWARKKLSVVQLREGIKLARVAQILSRCARSTYRTMWRWNGTPHRASFNREDRLATRYLLDRRESKNDLYRRSLLEKAKRHFHCRPLACQPTDSGIKASARSWPQTVALITSTR